MSLKKTFHSKSWNSIPKKCKRCIKSIYTVEDDDLVLYQCSLHGKFKRVCEKFTGRNKDSLPTLKEIRGKE